MYKSLRTLFIAIFAVMIGFGVTVPVLAFFAERLALAVLALGAAVISPNLAALVSRRGGVHTGAALGAQGAANSLGQFAGPAFGGVLFAWQTAAPYVFGGAFLFGAALLGRYRPGDRCRSTTMRTEPIRIIGANPAGLSAVYSARSPTAWRRKVTPICWFAAVAVRSPPAFLRTSITKSSTSSALSISSEHEPA